MQANIYDAVRTPRGKGQDGGALAEVSPIELLGGLFEALESRGLERDRVEDIFLGCATQTREQGANIARIAAIAAGWLRPSGVTVNRFCASSLSALSMGAASVCWGPSQTVIAGGVELMSQVPMFSDEGAWFSDGDVRRRTGFVHMGVAADLLAAIEGHTREDLEQVARRSHARASVADSAGWFDRTRVAVRRDEETLLAEDELIRRELSPDGLARLTPLFAAQDHGPALMRYPEIEQIPPMHTAATSPGVADGAALIVVASEHTTGLGRPRARIRAVAEHTVDPVLMLTGNPGAIRSALDHAGLSIRDVDLFEINESFASTILHAQSSLDIEPDRLNVVGGALAMGHPIGATGAMLVTTLLDELERRDLTLGVASICGGAGIATAAVIERI